jgi:hypothetical protein
MATSSTLPPDLFDQTTIISLLATVAILAVALALSRQVLDPKTSSSLRFLFIWHAFDALIHFFLEGSFLYHCFFSSLPVADLPNPSSYFPDPHNFLGHTDRIHGSQAGGENPFAQLWMVYARADRRWAGIDLVGRCFVGFRRFGNGRSGLLALGAWHQNVPGGLISEETERRR